MMNENEIRDYLQQQTETIRGVAATSTKPAMRSGNRHARRKAELPPIDQPTRM